MKIHVCSKLSLPQKQYFNPDYIISIQNHGIDATKLCPIWFNKENHKTINFRDIADKKNNESIQPEQMETIIQWGEALCQENNKIIIHCDAGISRSPATAFIFWNIYLGKGEEAQALEMLEESCENDFYAPNRLMIEYADILLARQGKLIKTLADFNKKQGIPENHKKNKIDKDNVRKFLSIIENNYKNINKKPMLFSILHYLDQNYPNWRMVSNTSLLDKIQQL